jgi:hypothetical protein
MARTWQQGQDNLERKSIAGQLGQDNHDRITVAGPYSWSRIVGIGQLGHIRFDRVA